MTTTKIFKSGNSQAVRIPSEFRFPRSVTEVSIVREGSKIVLEPVSTGEWPNSFWDAFGGFPEDFERPSQVPDERESLDR